MAKVTFLTFYNDFSVGINVLTSLLDKAGHDVSTIFFKIPSVGTIPWFTEEATEFMEAVDSYGNIVGGNAGYNRWTAGEVGLLKGKIADLSPDILCVSCRTMDNELAQEVLPELRAVTGATFLAGGFGPSLNPEIYAPLVDYVFVGEAEGCIDELVCLVAENGDVKGFDNIAYLEKGELVRNPLGSPDNLKFTTTREIEKTFYIDGGKLFSARDRAASVKTHTYSTFLGRGCISTCSYCSTGNWRELYRAEGHYVKPRRNRSLEDVMEELIAAKKTGVTFIHFRDEFMTAGVDTLKRFFELYEREIHLPFWAYLVPQQIVNHPELLSLAVDAGFVDTEIGFQSGSDRINRTVFTRRIPHRYTLEYTRMLSAHHINRKYDFIIFNPAETWEQVRETFALIQALPKERAYLYLPRLFYFPSTPINELLRDYRGIPVDFEYYYRIALLYLICFVVDPVTFEGVLKNEKLFHSSRNLLDYYRNHLAANGIEFPIGTHAVPASITTHRYERIMKKYGYQEVVALGDEGYFREMEFVFDPVGVRHIRRENVGEGGFPGFSPEEDELLGRELPVFICSPEKQEIRKKLFELRPDYPGRIYV